MKLIKHFKNLILFSCLILSSSCSKQETPTSIPVSVFPLPTPTSSADMSKSRFWLNRVSEAEKLWTSSKINSYEVVGRMAWGWHEHSFQVAVKNGEIINSKCESYYDEQTNDMWCQTEFVAQDYTIPALFQKARELITFGDEMTNSQTECFYASFDYDIGVPTNLSFDCPKAHDEEEGWEIIFFRNVP